MVHPLTRSIFFEIVPIIVAFVIISITYIKWVHQYYWKRRNVPYIEPNSIFGNLEPFYKQKMTRSLLIKKYYDEIKNNNQIKESKRYFGLYLMLEPVFIPIDLDLIKSITTKDFKYFANRIGFSNKKNDPINEHLLTMVDNEWHNMRTKLTPAFTLGKLKSMFPIICECSEQLEILLTEKVHKKEVIDAKEVAGCYATDIIGSCAFGLECNSFKDQNSPFRVYSKKVFRKSSYQTFLNMFVLSFPDLAKFLKLKLISKDISDFFMKVIKDTVNYRLENNVNRKDFLQLLIDMKSNGNNQSLTIEEIAAQSFLFYLAGFETSSTLMSFALYELARNQDIQDRVREEIKTVLEKHNGEITYDSINEMKYLSQVIDETLRMYPPAPFIGRKCSKDYRVPDSDLIIENGTHVILPVYAIHHDPEHYPNPNIFDPERFSEENRSKINWYSYLPFGEGPRNCIGMRFGLTQTKVGLMTFIRNYKFFVNSKTKEPLKMDIFSNLLSVKDGIWLDVKKN